MISLQNSPHSTGQKSFETAPKRFNKTEKKRTAGAQTKHPDRAPERWKAGSAVGL